MANLADLHPRTAVSAATRLELRHLRLGEGKVRRRKARLARRRAAVRPSVVTAPPPSSLICRHDHERTFRDRTRTSQQHGRGTGRCGAWCIPGPGADGRRLRQAWSSSNAWHGRRRRRVQDRLDLTGSVRSSVDGVSGICLRPDGRPALRTPAPMTVSAYETVQTKVTDVLWPPAVRPVT